MKMTWAAFPQVSDLGLLKRQSIVDKHKDMAYVCHLHMLEPQPCQRAWSSDGKGGYFFSSLVSLKLPTAPLSINILFVLQ